MRHKNNNHAMNKPDGLPSILTIFIAIMSGKMLRIVKNQYRLLEANPMFS